MIDSPFQQQLQSIVTGTRLELRAQFQQTIDQVTGYGIGSFEDMLTVAQDETVDPEIRIAVCWLLGQFREKRAAHAVLRAFGSEHAALRGQAAHVLGQLGSKVAVKPLLRALQMGRPAERRSDAAYALGHIGDARAAEPLLRALTDPEEDARVRGQAAESLAYLPGRAADVRAALIAALADSGVEVRFWAAFALGRIADASDHEAIDALEHLASSDSTSLPGWWSVSQEATAALEQIKHRADLDVST